MPENDVVGDGRKQAMAAFAAFYSRLFANALTPFIRADGRVSGFFRCLAYPADRVDILPTTKEPSEELDLRLGRQLAGITLNDWRGGHHFGWRRNAMHGQQRFQCSIFSA